MVGKILKSAAAVLGILISIAVVGILWPSSSAPLPDAGRDHQIRNVRVVDVESGVATAPTSVLIRDGRIAAIGAAALDSRLPVIDGRGGYLVPGFWDMHVHSFQLSPQLHFPLFIANGVTGVRDMMDCPGERDSLIACAADKRRWTAEAAAGRLAAPRFVSIASYYLENPALTPQQADERVRAAAGRRLDEVKIYNRLSRDAYARAASAARRLRIRLSGHLPKAVALGEALAAGQRSFEHAHLFPRHCYREAAAWRNGTMDEEEPTRVAESMVAQHDGEACRRAFAAMNRAGAWFVPTHVTREEDARAADDSFVGDVRLSYLDPLSRWAFRDDLGSTRTRYPGARGEQALRAYFEHGLRLTGAAHRAGVPILVGTDTVIGGFRYHDEMALLVRAGMSPGAVLRAATLDAARYAGLERTHGSVAVGKQADLVLLAANPFDDIRNTRRIRFVMLGGRLYDRARLDALLEFTRGQAAAPTNWIKLLWGFARSTVASEL